MKRTFAFLLVAFAAASAQAGSFGGPPPFTNGSPLQSGVNGAYQASARGSNLSGIITFAYSGGVQTTTASQNKWVIFYQGEVFAGFTDAAINDGNISGVLETSTLTPKTRTSSNNSTTSGNSTDSLSVVVVAPGTPSTFTSNFTSTTTSNSNASNTLAALANPSGYFDAKLNNNSPTGSFKGSGVLSGVFTNTNVNGSSLSSNSTSGSSNTLNGVTTTSGPTATGSSSTTTGVTTPTIDASFKVKGVRANTGT
jgi:hypothetical protein